MPWLQHAALGHPYGSVQLSFRDLVQKLDLVVASSVRGK